jgi:YbbR domain-containing protein
MIKKKTNQAQPVHEHAVPDVVVAKEQTERKQRHILAKFLCLIAAICVWMYVMNLESINYERTFTQVPVVIDGVAQLNANSNMSVISGYDNAVDVVISGKKSDVQNLTAEEIRVSVDISTMTQAGKFSVPVEVQVPAGFAVINADLLNAELYVDVNTERQVPVRITNLDYIVSSSYTMGTPILSHETVTVKGPAQVLDLIECAALEFDLGTVTTSTIMVGTPRLEDVDGVRVSNPYVRCDVNEVTVEIPVTMTKEIPLVASYKVPELKNGWKAEIRPATVTVVGDPMLMTNLNEIVVYEIPVGVVEGEYVVGGGVIDLPMGVSAVNAPTSIVVIVRRVLG